VNFTHEILTMFVGAIAGGLGALLGIGGSIILIPFLQMVVGLSFVEASGIGIVTVIATSSATTAAKGRLAFVNLRLAIVLEMFTTTGGLFAIYLIGKRQDRSIELAFAWTLIAIALIMLSRIDKRNVMDASTDIGLLGGRFQESESGGTVAYRLRRPFVAMSTSFVAGMISVFGIGGGIINVPALNSWCGVPIRAAAATSSIMLGVTALVVATERFRNGQVNLELAAAAVLGVVVGTQVGLFIQRRSKAKTHKLVMVGLLLAVASLYLSGLVRR
jgi:uncharacterized membrane protein YfcA